MTKDGKTYHWCTHHNMWNFHKTSDCKARIKAEAKPADDTYPPATDAASLVSYAAIFAATMTAICEDEHPPSDALE